MGLGRAFVVVVVVVEVRMLQGRDYHSCHGHQLYMVGLGLEIVYFGKKRIGYGSIFHNG